MKKLAKDLKPGDKTTGYGEIVESIEPTEPKTVKFKVVWPDDVHTFIALDLDYEVEVR